MSKKKKTRQQKIISDLRKKISLQVPSSDSSNTTLIDHKDSKLLIEKHFIPATKTPIITLHSSHIYKDLMKTAILTSLLIAGELLIYIAFKKDFFGIPGLHY